MLFNIYFNNIIVFRGYNVLILSCLDVGFFSFEIFCGEGLFLIFSW